MHPVLSRYAMTCAAVCLFISSAVADNWPRFRGPNGTGITQAAGIPSTWSEKDMAWKVKLPGTGHSSPVIWEDTVYVTCADEKAHIFSLLALRSSDGSTLWKRDYAFKPLRLHAMNNHAVSTPAVDERGVYAISFGENQSDRKSVV